MKKTLNQNDPTPVSCCGCVGGSRVGIRKAEFSTGSGIGRGREGAAWQRQGDGNDPAQPGDNTYLGGRPSTPCTPATGAPPAGLGSRPHHCSASAGSGPGSPLPGPPARRPRSPSRSLPPVRRTAAATRHRAPGARLPAPSPAAPRSPRAKETGQRPRQRALTRSWLRLVTGAAVQPTVLRPPHPLMGGWEAGKSREECQEGGHFRSLALPDFVWLLGRKCTYAKRHFC